MRFLLHAGSKLAGSFIVAAVLLAAAAPQVGRQMYPQPGPPPYPIPAPPLPPHPVIQRALTLTDMRVDVRIDGSVAKTTVRQTLRNDGYAVAEGTYLLPLPKGASVTDFAILDGDRRLEAKLLDAAAARQTYQDIVRRMRDPGLLEYQDSASYSVAVFPFQPGESRSIEVSFQQAIGGTTDLLTYQLPLRWAGWSLLGADGAGANFTLTYDVVSPFPLGAISSPSYGLSVNRDGDKHASGSVESKVAHFSSDFALNIARRTGDFAATLALSPGGEGEDGYFLLSLLAALPADKQPLPKDVLIVLDKSGSMEGDKIAQAKGALRFVLDRLAPSDRFNLVYFSDAVASVFNGLSAASPENVAKARAAVETLTADGGTDINSALGEAAKEIGKSERPAYVLFLTDGLPTVGVTDVSEIAATAKSRLDPRAKLFVFGVGYDVNTTLLDTLSYDHHGSATYIAPEENLEAKVSEFYASVASPALTGVKLALSGLDTYDLMPREAPDLFNQRELFITGRYRSSAAAHVNLQVDGTGAGQSRSFSATLTPGATAGSSIPRLWATRKVSWLLDQARLNGQRKELLDEIDRLATRFGIVTPYTSYLITEPNITPMARRQMLEDNITGAQKDSSGQMAVGRSAYNQANQSALKASAPQAAGQTAGGAPPPAAAPPPPPPPPMVAARDSGEDEEQLRAAAHRSGQADVNSTVNYVGSQTFLRDDSGGKLRWVDARYVSGKQQVIRVQTYSDAYFKLLADYGWLGDYLAQGEDVLLVLDGVALETTTEDVKLSDADLAKLRQALGMVRDP